MAKDAIIRWEILYHYLYDSIPKFEYIELQFQSLVFVLFLGSYTQLNLIAVLNFCFKVDLCFVWLMCLMAVSTISAAFDSPSNSFLKFTSKKEFTSPYTLKIKLRWKVYYSCKTIKVSRNRNSWNVLFPRLLLKLFTNKLAAIP